MRVCVQSSTTGAGVHPLINMSGEKLIHGPS